MYVCIRYVCISHGNGMYVSHMETNNMVGSKVQCASGDFKVWVANCLWGISKYFQLKVTAWKRKRIWRENSWRYRKCQDIGFEF